MTPHHHLQDTTIALCFAICPFTSPSPSLKTPGAEKDSQNLRGFTALHAAAASNKVGAISLLLQAGAKVNLPSGHQG